VQDGANYDEVREFVVGAIRQITADREGSKPQVNEDSVLYDYDSSGGPTLGLDSLDALDVISGFEDHFGVEMPDDVNFEGIHTVRELVTVATQQIAAGTKREQ
jgi:acyl carrier protein